MSKQCDTSVKQTNQPVELKFQKQTCLTYDKSVTAMKWVGGKIAFLINEMIG